MNKIALNFIEKIALILDDSQQGTLSLPYITRENVLQFIPDECGRHSCLMWDFDSHTCTICEDCMLTEKEREEGVILGRESFVERPDKVYPCDANKDSFAEAIGLEVIDMTEIRDFVDALIAQDELS